MTAVSPTAIEAVAAVSQELSYPKVSRLACSIAGYLESHGGAAP